MSLWHTELLEHSSPLRPTKTHSKMMIQGVFSIFNLIVAVDLFIVCAAATHGAEELLESRQSNNSESLNLHISSLYAASLQRSHLETKL